MTENRGMIQTMELQAKKIQELETKLKTAIEALEKVEDTRKIGHEEPNEYTKLGCLANIASVALKEIT